MIIVLSDKIIPVKRSEKRTRRICFLISPKFARIIAFLTYIYLLFCNYCTKFTSIQRLFTLSERHFIKLSFIIKTSKHKVEAENYDSRFFTIDQDWSRICTALVETDN